VQHKELEMLIAVICSSLFDSGPADIHPASSVYMVLGMDMPKFEQIKFALEKLELAVFTSSTVKLTAAGMRLGKHCSEVLAIAEKA